MDYPPQRQFFKEFPTVPTGVQRGSERFPRRTWADNPPPRLEAWRCNLTALSHIHNLYFVASRHSILVYEPNFPDQKLSSQPSLVLHPTGSEPDNDEGSALGPGRTINNVLVDFLGNDEILLFALHNGHVIGYHVNQIQRAIDRRQEPDCVETIVGDDVRPFFTESVEVSAWGLAVHQEARLIAVSCNSHTVTVFALALTKETRPTRYWLPDRSQQYRIVTPDSQENIPCVAFCNTGDDPEGRWILTSDINGFTRILDLARCYRGEYPGVDMHAHRYCATIETARQKECGCHFLDNGMRFYLHATWGVMWLDRRAFKRTESVSEALGSEGIPLKVERLSSTTNCYDNSSNRQRVRNASTVFSYVPDGIHEEDLDDSDSDDARVWEPRNEAQIARNIHIRRKPFNPGGVISTPIKIPASPIMRLSVKDMFLIQPRSSKSGERSPVGFFDPFYQYIKNHPRLEGVCMHDRINLHAQIVEIGIVVIGSAKGRAAVISLTQADEEGSKSRRPFYGCRIDWILPFRDQEQEGKRPVAPLVGIAVGPVQGMLGRQADFSRRWRLLMMYGDNSVLTYELGKSREGRVNVHEFGGLVV